MTNFDLDRQHMRRALSLAKRGEGHVEPNPMVGCVIARGAESLAEGWHRAFGEDHAEVAAIKSLPVSADLTDASLYVTLEPCCHHGKTPPCTDAILSLGIRRVVVAHRDPFEKGEGNGIDRLRQSGLDVTVGVLETEAGRLLAPYLTRLQRGRPWIIAKWAMTLDGKIATSTGESQWISGAAARSIVHTLRGRVDAILVGRGTAAADDPRLTARPAGVRTATRIVWSPHGILDTESQLFRTAGTIPVIVATTAIRDQQRNLLKMNHCQILDCRGQEFEEQLRSMFTQLADGGMTNVLVEGGGRLLGGLMDANLIDEVHVFLAPKLVGGHEAITPIAGAGIPAMKDALSLEDPIVQTIENDVYVRGRVIRP